MGAGDAGRGGTSASIGERGLACTASIGERGGWRVAGGGSADPVSTLALLERAGAEIGRAAAGVGALWAGGFGRDGL